MDLVALGVEGGGGGGTVPRSRGRVVEGGKY